jgi:FAD synthetase
MKMIGERQKRILAKIYASKFAQDLDCIDFLSVSLDTDRDSLMLEINALVQDQLVIFNGGRPILTQAGREKITVVMAGGSFDIIHPGHLETLEQARALGDSLIVSVARDATYRRNKKREPQHNEALRQKLVSSLHIVDMAVLGSEHDILETAVMLEPDIVALGYDQTHSETLIQDDLLKRGLKVKVVRLRSSIPEVKTSSLLKKENGNLLSSD